jgi:hypothetical protein
MSRSDDIRAVIDHMVLALNRPEWCVISKVHDMLDEFSSVEDREFFTDGVILHIVRSMRPDDVVDEETAAALRDAFENPDPDYAILGEIWEEAEAKEEEEERREAAWRDKVEREKQARRRVRDSAIEDSTYNSPYTRILNNLLHVQKTRDVRNLKQAEWVEAYRTLIIRMYGEPTNEAYTEWRRVCSAFSQSFQYDVYWRKAIKENITLTDISKDVMRNVLGGTVR